MNTDAAFPMSIGPDISLLDYLANQMKKAYLSDLLYDSAENIRQMVQYIPADSFALREWIDAIRYFFRETTCSPSSSIAAKSFLLDLLGGTSL